MPSRWKTPICLLSRAIGRSPCRTRISTEGWLSAAVEKIWALRAGIVVPRVSIPRDSGVTSSRRMFWSWSSPVRIPPWMEAPIATTSSGFTLLLGSLPKKFFTSSCTYGIRVEPPTRRTSSMSDGFRCASARALRHGSMERWNRLSESCSNFARVRVFT